MQPVLLFDGDCGFCTWCVDVASRWMRPGVPMQPWQNADLEQYGVTQAECEEAVQFVDSSGTSHSGSAAVARLLRTSRQPWPALAAAMELPGMREVSARTYRLVSAHRHRLPGSTPACARTSQSSMSTRA